MRLNRESIAGLAARLRDMHPEPSDEVSKQEAVRLLSLEIKSMQKRGFTIAKVVARLRDNGLDIAPNTLKNYLRRARASSPQATNKAARKHPARTDKRPRSVASTASLVVLPAVAQAQHAPAAAFTPAVDSEEL